MEIIITIWKLLYNIEIDGYRKKSDENNQKNKGLQSQGEIREIRINFFTRKKNERLSNRTFQSNN